MATSSSPKAETIRRRQPEQVRSRVLQAALSIFAARGFEGASMQKIADSAKVSLPLIVYHFKSKEKLWQAVIKNAVTQFDQLIELATQQTTATTATEQLREIIKAMVDVSVKFPEFRRILETEAYTLTPRLQWLGESFAKRHHKIITKLIKQAQSEGNVLMIEPHRLSFMITAMATNPSNAAEYQYLTGRDPSSKKEVKASIAAINKAVFIQ